MLYVTYFTFPCYYLQRYKGICNNIYALSYIVFLIQKFPIFFIYILYNTYIYIIHNLSVKEVETYKCYHRSRTYVHYIFAIALALCWTYSQLNSDVYYVDGMMGLVRVSNTHQHHLESFCLVLVPSCFLHSSLVFYYSYFSSYFIILCLCY